MICPDCTNEFEIDREEECTCDAIAENMDFDWKPSEADPHHMDCPQTNGVVCDACGSEHSYWMFLVDGDEEEND